MFRPPELEKVRFAAFVSDVRLLLAAVPSSVKICGEKGAGAPEASEDRVAFNGEKSLALDHEPLVVERVYSRRPPSRMRGGEFFDFCKTAGKPYDLLVVAALYAFAYRFPSCRIASDSSLDELRAGFEFFCSVCKPEADLAELFSCPKRHNPAPE
jgi:hypothetical protein